MSGNSVLEVLQEIHRSPKKLQSNYSRDNAQIVGRLASQGLITTRFSTGGASFFGHTWRVTFAGLRVIELGEST